MASHRSGRHRIVRAGPCLFLLLSGTLSIPAFGQLRQTTGLGRLDTAYHHGERAEFASVGATVSLVPIAADGDAAIVGNEIILQGGGQRVFLEIRLSGWAPSRIGDYQVSIDQLSFSSGSNGAIGLAAEACTSDPQCVAALGQGSVCDVPPAAGVACTPAFIDKFRPSYVFSCCSNLTGWDLDGNPRVGALALSGSAADQGAAAYGGTLVLDVPPTARGLFTISIFAADTIVRDQTATAIEPLTLVSALIRVIDCNENSVSDLEDIGNQTSPDCNANYKPDECEIDRNSAAPGGPFFCDAQCDPDCNDNGDPDECDLLNCPGDPDCDDCNLDNILDECNIADATSQDTNLDRIPDDCVTADPAGGNWTDPTWGLPGPNPYPDNTSGVPDLNVTIESGDVLVDIDVVADSLRILPDGTLLVTQEGQGNLTIVDPGGVLNEGTILVANDRDISVPNGSFTIGPGGQYLEDPMSTDVTSATLTAAEVTIEEGSCDPPVLPGEMVLSDSMSVTSTGDFVLDGSGSDPNCSGPSVAGGSVAGGRTPPVIRVIDSIASPNPTLAVAGSIQLLGAAEFCIDCDTPQAAPPTVTLAGGFDNQSLYPSLFNWTIGTLQINGTTPQLFEVGGLDVGGIPEGFATNRDTLFDSTSHTNYSIPRIEVQAGAEVSFVNQFANSAGTGCTEALYVGQLALAAGATVRVDNARVYFDELIDDDAMIETVGCGALVQLCRPAPPALDSSPIKNRFVSFVGGNPGFLTAVQVVFDDLPAPFDLWEGARMWVGPPVDGCETAGIGAGMNCGAAPTFKAAALRCTPHLADWSAIGPIHVYGQAIVPGGRYTIREVYVGCDQMEEASYAAAPPAETTRWGDTCGNFVGGAWGPPDESVNVTSDVVATLEKFANRNTAPVKVRADVEPACADLKINISDVTQVLNGFRSIPYPYSPPGPNPCVSPCP